MEEKVLVVIPYLAEGAQGRELEFCLAGWRNHFKEDYLLVFVGENLPYIKGDDVFLVESERVPAKKGMYRQHLDYVSCFRKVRKFFPKQKGFVFVADDCYAVNDFDLSDIKVLKQIADEFTGNPYMGGWQLDMARTRELLDREKLPSRNFTTHLPQWFEWDKLFALYDRYDMDNNSYVFENIYYNYYYPTRKPFTIDEERDNFKCGVHRRTPTMVDNIRKAFDGKIWVQNAEAGYTYELEKMLTDYYGLTPRELSF